MADQPTDEEILRAVEESGYLLEQETATTLEAAGFLVETNAAFLDPDENKSREIDVIARKELPAAGTIRVFLELIVECKKNAYPLVFLARRKNVREESREPREFLFPTEYLDEVLEVTGNRSTHRHHSPFRYLKLDKLHYYYSQQLRSTQACAVLRKGKHWEATHAGDVDAITFPLAKAVEARRTNAVAVMKRRDIRYIWLLVPLVVLTGPLFTLDTTASPSQLTPARFTTLVRELKTTSLNDIYVFDFVQSAELGAFLSGPFADFTSHVHSVAQSNEAVLTSGRIPTQR